MNFKEFSTWAFTGAVLLLISVLGYFGTQSLDELRNIRRELTDVKINLVLVTGNQDSFRRELDRMDKRVEKLENKP